ncbi:Ulp1 protease family, C-terminal catalytic domain [Phytophthora cactorum]|nr:Ulp1 protease family, C-terminal catalytic domain [Phytophthora cactorum]
MSSTKVIRLNPSSSKEGQPRLYQTEQRSKARAALQEYNPGVHLRTRFRESDVSLWVWQQVFSDSYQCCSWVSSVVASIVEQKGDAGSVIVEFMTSWSQSALPDFGFDNTFAELFRFRGGTWLNDGAIRAFSVYLKRPYENNVTVFLDPVSTICFEGPCAAQIRACLQEEQIKYVLLLKNIDTNHWIWLVIDLDAMKIYVYDSVKSRKISKGDSRSCKEANGRGAKGQVPEASSQDADSEI